MITQLTRDIAKIIYDLLIVEKQSLQHQLKKITKKKETSMEMYQEKLNELEKINLCIVEMKQVYGDHIYG